MACDVFNAYIKPRSSPVRLHLTQKMIADMDQFIQGNKVSAELSSCIRGDKVFFGTEQDCCHQWSTGF